MPRGLKITNRADMTLHDSALTTGVEYEDEDYVCDNKKEESEEEIKYSYSDSDSSNSNDSLSEWVR